MAESSDESDKDIIAKLRSELVLREKEIVAKEVELKNASTAFTSVLALKNQKIRELEVEITRLKSESLKQNEVASRRDMVAVVAMEGRQRHALDAMKKEIEDCGLHLIIDLSYMLLLYVVYVVQAMRLTLEKNSLDLKSKLIWTDSDTIRATFTAVSKMTDTLVSSRTANKAGLNSAIHVRTHFDKSTKYLAAFLRLQGSNMWSGTVTCCIKLIRTGLDPYVRNLSPLLFTPTNYCWGVEQFISFEDLHSPSNKFIEDDSIRMEISFTAYPSN